MTRKSLIVLLLVTVVAVAAAIVSNLGGGTGQNNPLAGKAVFPQLASRLADIDRVALMRESQKTTLKRGSKSWTVEEKGGYPANVERVRHLLLGLAELRYVEPKTKKERFYPRLEVEDAGSKNAKSTLITVADAKGALLAEIIAGKRKYDELGGDESGIYVRKPGEAQSWLTRGSLDLSDESTAWLDTKLMDIPEAQIKEAVFIAPDGAKVAISRAKPETKFVLAGLPKGRALKSDNALDQPANALAALELADVRPVKGFAFPKKDVWYARFVTFDGMTVSLDIDARDKSGWTQISSTGTAAGQALDAKTAPWVFALPPYKIEALETRLGALLAPPKSKSK
jgi:Domain of unknown function (DUF4340)